MAFWNDWSHAANRAAERAAAETCAKCEAQKVVGYSNLGIPLVACPNCQPDLVRNGQRTVDEIFYGDRRAS
jgi:hypothetical protein